MRNLGRITPILIVFIVSFLTCMTPPSNPFIPSNTQPRMSIDTVNQKMIVGDTVRIWVRILVSEYADSMQVYFGDGDSVLIHRDDLDEFSADTIKHVYRSPGSFTISTTIFINNGNKRKDTPATVRIRTHLVYDGNGYTGGNVPVDSAVYAKDDPATVRGNTDSLIRTGYVFGEWNKKPDGTGASYNGGSVILIDSVNTLYATWSKNPVHTITFDKNDSNATGSMATQSIASGLSANITRNGFIKPGYIFMGWAITPAGMIAYLDSASILMGSNNVTLYARWTQNTLYTVTFNKNDSNATGTMAAQPIANGASANLTPNGFTKPGSIFSGWATTPAGAAVYIDTAKYLMGSANVTLYARWTQNPVYTVTFNKNDTTTTGTMAVQSIASGSSTTLTTNSYVKPGWFFAGWSTTPSGGVEFSNTANYTMGNANVTLYAKWTQNSMYSVTFDKNDTNATGTMGAQSIASGTSVKLSANGFSKIGSKFAGWATTPAGSVFYLDTASYVMGTVNVTLYAKWTQNASYAITFNKNDTAATGNMTAQTIVSGLSTNLTSNGFSKTGWFFAGWTTTPTGAIAYTDRANYQMGTTNVILYAKWTQNASYTITYNKNDTAATGNMADQTIVSGLSVILTNNGFSKTSWIFAGWATTSNGAVVYTDGTTYQMGSANVILYAIWFMSPYIIAMDTTPRKLIVGDTLRLSVTAGGKPTPTFQWRRNGAAISGATNSNYTNSNVSSSDCGNYTVELYNIADTITTPAINVIVVPLAPSGVTVIAGSEKVIVTWNQSSGATGYTVNWYPSATPGSVTVRSGRLSPDTVNGLTAGVQYSFYVTAQNSFGLSGQSIVKNAIPGAKTWQIVGSANLSRALNGGDEERCLAIDSKGVPYVLYGDTNGNVSELNVKKFEGGSWKIVGGGPILSSDRAISKFSSWKALEISSTDIPYVAARYTTNVDNSRHIPVFKLQGSGWLQVGLSDAYSTDPVIDLAVQNVRIAMNGEVPYVSLLRDNATGTGMIMPIRGFNGSTWERIGVSDDSIPAFPNGIDICFVNGTLYMGYDTGTGSPIIRQLNGTTWQTVGSSVNLGAGTPVAFGVYNGILHVLMVGANSVAVYKYAGNSSWARIGGLDAYSGTQQGASMAINKVTGDVYATILSTVQQNIIVVKWDGKSWITMGNTNFTADIYKVPNTAVDPMGTPYVSFRNPQNGGGLTVISYR